MRWLRAVAAIGLCVVASCGRKDGKNGSVSATSAVGDSTSKPAVVALDPCTIGDTSPARCKSILPNTDILKSGKETADFIKEIDLYADQDSTARHVRARDPNDEAFCQDKRFGVRFRAPRDLGRLPTHGTQAFTVVVALFDGFRGGHRKCPEKSYGFGPENLSGVKFDRAIAVVTTTGTADSAGSLGTYTVYALPNGNRTPVVVGSGTYRKCPAPSGPHSHEYVGFMGCENSVAFLSAASQPDSGKALIDVRAVIDNATANAWSRCALGCCELDPGLTRATSTPPAAKSGA
jgi:hypothetical protein